MTAPFHAVACTIRSMQSNRGSIGAVRGSVASAHSDSLQAGSSSAHVGGLGIVGVGLLGSGSATSLPMAPFPQLPRPRARVADQRGVLVGTLATVLGARGVFAVSGSRCCS